MLASKVFPLSPAEARVVELEKENADLWARIEALQHENALLSLEDERSHLYYEFWRKYRK